MYLSSLLNILVIIFTLKQFHHIRQFGLVVIVYPLYIPLFLYLFFFIILYFFSLPFLTFLLTLIYETSFNISCICDNGVNTNHYVIFS